MDLNIKSYFEICDDNEKMYLIYGIATRELIGLNDDYDGERNFDFDIFVNYSDSIVIVNDEKVDFVETRFNEDSQLTLIIP